MRSEELRRAEPISSKPFSSEALRECYGKMVISGGDAPPRPARAADRGSKHSNRRHGIQAIHLDTASAEVDGGQLASSAA
jgi:hypothetical protein